jgi:hypothetical protein
VISLTTQLPVLGRWSRNVPKLGRLYAPTDPPEKGGLLAPFRALQKLSEARS